MEMAAWTRTRSARFTIPRSRRARVLRVGLHAAKGQQNVGKHIFQPIRMTRMSRDPFVMFSDPTLSLVTDATLGWYLGTSDVDPHDAMEVVVRRMMRAAGATHVVVQGSSGGGFAAMRFAARFAEAAAVAMIPQTELFRYHAGSLGKILRQAWPGWTWEQILAEHPRRFRLADIYGDDTQNQGNLVHYVQNILDRSHMDDHLEPFLAELGEAPDADSALGGRIRVRRVETEEGHIPVPRDEWLLETRAAISRLTGGASGHRMDESARSWQVAEAREKNIADTPARCRTW